VVEVEQIFVLKSTNSSRKPVLILSRTRPENPVAGPDVTTVEARDAIYSNSTAGMPEKKTNRTRSAVERRGLRRISRETPDIQASSR
jgi:hypothetical protein